MKLVYVTPFLTVPPDFGLGVRNFHIVQGLAAKHQVQVVAYADPETGAQTDAWLAAQGCTITRLPYARSWAAVRQRRETFRLLWQYPALSFVRMAPQALAECLRTLTPAADLVVFDTQLTGQAVLHGALPCPSVLVLADVYEDAQWRQLRVAGLRPYAAIYAADWLKTRHYERRIVRRFRHVVAVSQNEQHRLRQRFPQAEVFLSPNGVAVAAFAPRATRPMGQPQVLFVGGFHYAPNVEAFLYFCRQVWPLVRAQHPAAQFVAVGRQPTPAMQACAAQTPGVRLTGAVPAMPPYYAQATLAVVPLLQGGGTKLKTLEAFAAGVPVVSTSVGCEGIVPNIEDYVRRADDPAQLAAHINAILADPASAQPMAQRARQLAQTQFDWPQIVQAFEAHLAAIVAGA